MKNEMYRSLMFKCMMGISPVFLLGTCCVSTVFSAEPPEPYALVKRLPEGARQARQLAESVDAGDFYLTPDGRRPLNRWPRRVLVRGQGGKTASETADLLTAGGRPLAGYIRSPFGKNAYILTEPEAGRQQRQTDAASVKASLQTVREKASGVRVDPVFVDPESGLLMTVGDDIILCLAQGTDVKTYFGAEWPRVRPLPGTKDQFVLTLDAPTAETVLEACVRRAADTRVKWAEPDFKSEAIKHFTPNDTYFNQQWHLKGTGTGSVQAESAWNVTTGTDVVIAIVDDGVQIGHPDLAANIFVNTGEIAGNGVDDDSNGYVDDVNGWNVVEGTASVLPADAEDSHGTAVAGVAAAVGNNAVGVAGAAFRSKIMPVKMATGADTATSSEIASAFRYAAGLTGIGWRGADVINFSWSYSSSTALNSALTDAALQGRGGKGCAIFVSSGNGASGWYHYSIPVTSGSHTLKFEYQKDYIGYSGLDRVWLDDVYLPGVGTESFEGTFPPSDWTVGGNSPWIQNSDPIYAMLGTGTKSARSGAIGNSQTSTLQVTKTFAAGTINFYLWTSSEAGYDVVNVYLDGVKKMTDPGGVYGYTTVIAYPASHSSTIAVGASTDADYKAYYSQYGTGLDFVAPSSGGVSGIYTTDRTGSDGYSGTDYDPAFGGTSSASPLEAGIGALALSVNPQLSAADVRAIMRRSCDKIGGVTYSSGDTGAGGWNTYYGYGRINADTVVRHARVAFPVISTNALTVTEGGTVVMTISLAAQPPADVTVTTVRNSGDTSLNVNAGSSRTFTTSNWSTPQTVTFSAAEDDADTANGIAQFACSALGCTAVTVTVTEADDDFALTVNSAGNGAVSGGGIKDRDNSPFAISATPDTGYAFSTWTGPDAEKVANVHTATTTIGTLVAATVTATFAEIVVPRVVVSPTGGGTAVTEGGATDTYGLVLTTQPTASVIVGISSGSELTVLPSSLTFTTGNWSATQTVTVAAVNDTLYEGSHSGTITHAASSGDSGYNGISISNVTVTVTDNDSAPTVAFSAASQSKTESGGTATVTAQLSAVSGLEVTVPFSVSGTATGGGTDYSVTASPIIIPAGSTTGSATVMIVDDALDEADETVIVTIGTPTNASKGTTTVHTLTITDNDSVPTVAFAVASQSKAEYAGTAAVTVQLSAFSGLAVTVPFTVSGTATGGGTDYSVTASPITIPAGSLAGSATVTLVNDTLAEDDETVVLTMGAPVNAVKGSPSVHTLTIADNDSPNGNVLYVDAARPDDSGDGASWATAKRTLQAAVDAAQDGDTVLVTNGVYNAGGAITPGYTLPCRVVITNNIEVRSVNGAETTIIQGPGTNTYGTANAMRCVYMSSGLMEGFTIRGGAIKSWSNNANDYGAGFSMYNASGNPEVRNCIISNNYGGLGGGSYGGKFTACQFVNNRASYGGGAQSGTLYGCALSKNIATGAGDSPGGGANGCTLTGCLIVGNYASYYGGGAGSSTLYNCLVVSNRCDRNGGGTYSGTVKNCTVVDNTAAIYGAGTYSGTLYNSIVWANSYTNGVTNDCYSSSTYYTCASGLSAASGCTNANPLFVDEATGDYRLQANSPCIDKGYNSYAPDLPDLDGSARFVDGNSDGTITVDMGAYEFGSAPVVATPDFSPRDGTSFTDSLEVELACATPGAQLRYTLDGSTPTTNSALFTTPIVLTVTTTVKAKAFKPGMPDSAMASATYTMQSVATPVFSPASGTAFTNSVAVTLVCATPGAEIRYTLNGTTPTTNSAFYSGTLTIASNTTVYAKAFKSGMTASATASATYYRRYFLTVSGGTGSGMYAAGASVSVAADTTSGQVLAGWTVSPTGVSLGTSFDNRETLGSLVMPTSDVTLTPVYRAPTTFYVDASRTNDSGDGLSWATAKRTIQAAVNAAGSGNGAADTVLVTNGIYAVGGAITPGYSLSNRVMIAKNLTLRSVNGASSTVIEGAGTNAYATAAAMRCVYLGRGTLIGFTLRKGATLNYSSSTANGYGAGVCADGAQQVCDCVISNNLAYYGGGSYNGTLTTCLLANNTARYGGGTCQGTLKGCRIVGNNSSSYGGGAYAGTLYNCILANNRTVNYGGACYAGTLYNCTLVGNTAVSDGSGLCYGYLYNCIAWANTYTNGVTNDCYSVYGTYYTCASGLSSASGCTNANPLFVNESGGDYHLQASSPCIDKGSNSFAPELPDLDGNARLSDGDGNGSLTVDMGAYEFGAVLGVATPVFTPGGDSSFTGTLAVTLTCATEGAAIRYTVDGATTPTTNSTLYTGPLTLSVTTTVKAKAFKSGLPDSAMTTATFTKGTVAAPTATPSAYSYFTGTLAVSFACATAGAEIRYTLDGSTPTLASPLYSSPLTLSSTTTIYARAFKPGLTDSSILNAVYYLNSVSTPTVVPSSWPTFTGSTTVTILCATGDAEIRYTLDGSLPTASNPLYTGPFTLTSTTTIKAKAFAIGLMDSAVAVLTVTQQAVATPVIAPPSTTGFTDNLDVTITCSTPSATIRYTTDGNEPTAGSPVYSGAITLTGSAVVKAQAYLDGMADSAVVGAAYTKTRTVYANAGRPDDTGDGLSWATAKRTLQAAADAASDGCTVLVTNGVYNAGGAVMSGQSLSNRLLIVKNLTVRSVNGADVTMIEGSGTNAYGTVGAMRCVYMTNGILSGFTLRAGTTKSTDDVSGYGAGVFATGGAVERCVIVGNKAYRGGGNYSAVLKCCTVTGNAAAFSGGGSAYGTLSSCLVANNASAVYCGGSYYSVLFNCTVVGNMAASSSTSAGIHNNGSSSRAYNCIAWGNRLSGGVTSDCYSVSYAYNTCASGLSSANGCTNANPLFLDEANGNYYLQASSPCVDKGSNSNAPDVPDLDGNARLADGNGDGTVIADMGAYEFGSAAGVATPVITPCGGTAFCGSLSVGITCSTEGAAIRYTVDGTTPTTNSTLYTDTFPIFATTTVKAKAFKSDMPDSATTSATLTYQTVTTPTFAPPSGTVFVGSLAVTVTCSTASGVIRYTLDGTTPTADSPVYAEPIVLTTNVTVNAKAFKLGMTASATASASYTLQAVATPTFSPSSGWTFDSSLTVTVTCATAGSTVRYTTDGAEPNGQSAEYVSPVILTGTATLKAKAYAPGYAASATASAAYSKAIPIAEAVDAGALTFNVGGVLPWFGQAGGTTHDGVDAARSGVITHSQESWMQTTVTGSGTLTFWWKVSSEGGFDYLRFYIDGVQQNAIAGTVDWQQMTFPVSSGEHTLKWRYSKDGSVNTGSDCGWVDQLVWVADAQVTALGTPYAWLDQYGLVGGSNYEAADAADADGDGLATWQEYVAGTVPTNSASVFLATLQITDGQMGVYWMPDLTNASPARVYSVYGTPDLLLGFPAVPFTNVPAGSPVPLLSLSTNRFFKVGVEIQ